MCTSCGLLLCSVVSPSPLENPSPACPSCLEAVLDSRGRSALILQLNAKLAQLTIEHEEHVVSIRQERQQVRMDRQAQADLFPDLQSGAHTSEAPAESTYFHERQRQIDIAMGRRSKDPHEKKVRVLRIGSKPAATKAKKKAKEKGEKHAPASILDDIHDDKDDTNSAHLDEGVVIFDDPNNPLAPVSDWDDDGFRLHWGRDQEPVLPKAMPTSTDWWIQGQSPLLQYVIAPQRPQENALTQNDEDKQDAGVGAPMKRQVPGSAPVAKGKKGKAKQKS